MLQLPLMRRLFSAIRLLLQRPGKQLLDLSTTTLSEIFGGRSATTATDYVALVSLSGAWTHGRSGPLNPQMWKAPLGRIPRGRVRWLPAGPVLVLAGAWGFAILLVSLMRHVCSAG